MTITRATPVATERDGKLIIALVRTELPPDCPDHDLPNCALCFLETWHVSCHHPDHEDGCLDE